MDNNIGGVYEIRNNINGHFYIGSAVNIQKRWNLHKLELVKGTHHSVYLQRAWNKYGEDNFIFSILQMVDNKDKRIEAEQYFMDTLHPQYNIDPRAGSRLGATASKATKKKLRAVGASLTKAQREWRRNNIITTAIPAAKAWHSTLSGHEWHKKHYHENKNCMHTKYSLICDQCGKEYIGEKGRFCSNVCKSKWRRHSHLDDTSRECVICGNEFTANKYSDTKTCSRSCGSKLIWINHHAAMNMTWRRRGQ